MVGGAALESLRSTALTRLLWRTRQEEQKFKFKANLSNLGRPCPQKEKKDEMVWTYTSVVEHVFSLYLKPQIQPSALQTIKYNRDTREKGLTWRGKFWKCLHIDPNVIKTSNTDFFLSFFFLSFLFVNSSLMRIIPDFRICSWIPISSVPVPHQAFVWKAEWF